MSPVPAFHLVVSNHSYKTSLLQMWHSGKLSCCLQENKFNPKPDFYTLWLPNQSDFVLRSIIDGEEKFVPFAASHL